MPIPTAIVICFMLACVTLLAWGHRDPTIALTLGLTVLTGITYGEMRAVREQTNGNTSKMLDMVANSTPVQGGQTGGVQSGQSTGDGDAESVGTQGK